MKCKSDYGWYEEHDFIDTLCEPKRKHICNVILVKSIHFLAILHSTMKWHKNCKLLCSCHVLKRRLIDSVNYVAAQTRFAENEFHGLIMEVPDELIGQIAVVFAFPADYQNNNRYASIWEVSEKIHYCIITNNVAGLAGCHLSQCELAGNSEQVFKI